MILRKFNFPERLVNIIQAIYTTTFASFNINGKLTREIQLKSGVRQGCPLSPTLFALCIETLGNLIGQDPNYQGITVPNIVNYRLSKFADDTTLYIRNQNDLTLALNHINTYERGTAAKANVSKTELFPIGPNAHSTINLINPQNRNGIITILPYDSQVRF